MVWNKLKTYGELVMFRHTLFALPFGLMGAFLASGGWPPFTNLFWILVALVGARNAANALNRLIDWKIDAKNPRTASRHMPRGLVKPQEVLILSGVGLALMVLAVFRLNHLCVQLMPLAVIILVGYSYTKRFTWACHLVLGLAVGLAPLGAWIAITGQMALPPVILTLVVALWVAGFDIIYATQDISFDRKERIHSIPARFGLKNALYIARAFHLTTILLLLSVPLFLNLGFLYFMGILAAAGLLLYEHQIVSPDNLSRVKIASYHVNELIGVTVFAFTLGDMFIL
ncbi:UbiA-like polyprenyltransferase [Candidatus Contubernalis alkaliaceticus]|uniref:UbiA-like polyprenyltransferase n=1 Tax=Candidatus Contubernalis alkaliaceticus TaxID=338645 RepID=UPI001F4C2F89|nr:UbiA-like polyprenyltransferase [Candidatus Contubernalis alkalaceticus]UNC92800.1 UbiA family prenyltransferase [Candidatus Contubernalis alkalaceticus]